MLLQDPTGSGLFEETIIDIKLATHHLLMLALNEFLQDTCYGCQISHPSQVQHSCLLELPEYFFDIYYDDVMIRLKTDRFICYGLWPQVAPPSSIEITVFQDSWGIGWPRTYARLNYMQIRVCQTTHTIGCCRSLEHDGPMTLLPAFTGEYKRLEVLHSVAAA